MLRVHLVRRLSTCEARLKHPRVDWLTNDINGRHHYFRLHPNSRLPPAALMMLGKRKRAWRSTGGYQNYLLPNSRRRKFIYEHKNQKQLYDELCEFTVKLVKHEDLRPVNYVRFHIDRKMTKYELYNYLDKLYNVQMAHIELEAVQPVAYMSRNVDHPDNRDTENYAHERMFRDSAPNRYGQSLQGYGYNEGNTEREVIRQTDGYCIAHCYLNEGEYFFYPDVFGLEKEDENSLTDESAKTAILARLANNGNSRPELESLFEEYGLEEFNVKTETEELECGFSGFGFFAGTTQTTKTDAYTKAAASFNITLEEYGDMTEEELLATVKSEAEKMTPYKSEENLEDTTQILADEVRLASKTFQALKPQIQDTTKQKLEPFLFNGQDTYRNTFNPRGWGTLKSEEGEELNVPFPVVHKLLEEQILNLKIDDVTEKRD